MIIKLHLLFLIILLLNSLTQTIHATSSDPEILPGAISFKASLVEKIKNLKIQRGDNYKPRTKHLTLTGKAKYTNRLFLESSPYLLQHAHNPVNWYPWGDEAFAVAAKLKRPVLLSVGYSTCHWCHVMEEESFEDIEIATYINENFIAIKVDREERPDIDAIYMAALYALGQNGGWPMNVWLTPDRKPFYGGTYFPARDGDRGNSTGLLTVLKILKHTYQTRAEEIIDRSEYLANTIKRNLQPDSESTIPKIDVLKLAAEYYKNNFDAFYGGTGNAPKFPSSTAIQFLLRYHNRTGDKKSLEIVELTLTKMAAGGIYDQIGGGFHRYSIDNEWLVPHFEKMLYDNALLTVDYLEAYQVTKNKNFQRIANEILHYIKRDMTSAEGAFYSATDADSPTPKGDNEEGYFFTWSTEELVKTLGKKNSDIVIRYYSASKDGNFEGRNILNTPVSLDSFSRENSINKDNLVEIIRESNQILYQQRKTRLPPIRDEKILVAWNGLMISAFAKAGLILNNQGYIQQAINSAQFILDNLYINGRLFRSYKDGAAKHNAYLSDYAFLIASFLDLYEATYDINWLYQAIDLDKTLENHYGDSKNGGFYMTSNDHEKLIAREKPGYDGAEPTGNSIHALNLFRLGEFTANTKYTNRAVKTIKSFSSTLEKSPMALSKMLLAVDFYYDKAKEIIIVTPDKKIHESEKFINEFRKQFIPNRILSVLSEGESIKTATKLISIADGKVAINNKTTAYVCTLGSCELPTNNINIFSQQISKTEYPDK
ncbi:MAG: thioredoxin domain-containing protein [endosymbiont of Galathealinum brachiosum]|uniref:Thioredoxin domain-containing protein n=1 Tax=endosymbiont of Galathealinum brachiosum TaxID=2200906 RepID=A0A370DI27_9GAMM|nr:MAG: thioredoxin domain-containing protein [endosymbiont of Galathealinum brachiosum]